MTPPPTDEFEKLLLLRDAIDASMDYTSAQDAMSEFCTAAHAALGPEGCVTKELERKWSGWDTFQEAYDALVKHSRQLSLELDTLASENKRLRQDLQDARDLIPPDVGTSDSSVYGKLSAARSENKLLLASREQLGAENKALLQRVKDAEKETAVLMARLAKVSAAAEAYIDEDTIEKMMALRAVLNETPPPPQQPQPSDRFKSTSTLSPCPRCGETVPTTFKDGVLTYRCTRCAGDAP